MINMDKQNTNMLDSTTMEPEYSLKHDLTSEALPYSARAAGGVIVDIEGTNDTSLRLAKDGHTVLLPQPTDDANDPLNWPSWKKHAILFTSALGALAADYACAAGSSTIFLQGAQWSESPGNILQTTNICVLTLGIGGIIWIPMANFFGRAPVFFWTAVVGFTLCLISAVAPNYRTFFAMRALLGWFITPAQTISLALIKDMFFFHERARKIGLWGLMYISAPYFGPCFSNFILAGNKNWHDVYWVSTALIGLYVVMIVAFVDETWYNRNKHSAEQPARPSGTLGRLSRVVGIWEIQHHIGYYETVISSFTRLFRVILKPALFLVLLAYVLLFMWCGVGINISAPTLFETPVAKGGYGYTNRSLGFLYFTPIVSVGIAEVLGHWLNDFLARRYIHSHKGVFEPEARLTMIYIGAIFQIVGLVLVGQTLLHHLPVVGIVFGWGMATFGLMLVSVAVLAYALDSYPKAPAEVSGWVEFARVAGGFSVGYFEQPWGERVGYGVSFGTQAATLVFAMLLIGIAHYYGHALRLKAGPLPH